MNSRYIAIASAVFFVTVTSADFQTSGWLNQVTIESTATDDDSFGPLPSLLGHSERGVSGFSTLTGSPSEYFHGFSLSTVDDEGSGYGVEAYQRIDFEVDVATSVFIHGWMTGSGSVSLAWGLQYWDAGQNDYVDIAGEFLESEPSDVTLPFTVNSPVFLLQPGIGYRFTSTPALQSTDNSVDGELYLTAIVPSPQSAILGLVGLAMLGSRRSFFR